MEDRKSSSITQQVSEEIVVKVSSLGEGAGAGKSCQLSPSGSSGGVVKGNRRSAAAGAQLQSQELLGAHRHHTAMAQQQQQQAALGGQSDSSHGVGWGSAPSWEQARNIAESMEGGPPDYNGGRSVEWDVKGSCWDWEHVGPVYPSRRGDAHTLTVSFASGGQSSESVSVGVTVAAQGNRGSLAAKHESDHLDSTASDSSRRVGNLAGVEQKFPSSCSGFDSEQQRRLALGLGETVCTVERRKSNVQEYSNVGRVNVGGCDSLIGLKLGRRTYFEDSGGGRGAGPAVFAVCPPGKKQRVQSPGIQVPRCQVEGCKQDLSTSKDYHRRHKVCEPHSKAAKVMAAGYEQRFCQQCSRFHVLTEFDEGKRSCRRRLAGHNERRRKPQPESAAIVSTGSSAVFHNEGGSHASGVNGEEGNRGSNGLTEQACFIPMQRTPGSSSTSVDSDDQSGSLGGTNFKMNHGSKGPWSGLGRGDDSTGLACQSQVAACGERHSFLSSTTDRVRMFLQSPKGQIGGAGLHQHHYPVEGSGSMGPGLTLSSSSGPATVLAGLDAPTSPSVSGISDSGRALSLLSSQAWGSRGGASGSVSLAVSTQSDVTLEQLISENARTTFSPRGPQSHYHTSAAGNVEKLFRHQPHSPRDLVVSPVNQGEGREQHQGILSGLGMVGSFESHTMLAVMQGQSEFRAMQGSSSSQRPTIDLMQLPSPQSHGQFAEFSSLRPFESALFDSQQML